MEAVPRMPMVSFELKSCPESTSFGPLKQYVAEYYHEDPDSYSKECYQLEQLRGMAMRPSHDVEGTAVVKRYYCQLHSLQNRFLLNQLPESQQMLSFSWKDLYSGATLQKNNIKFEMAVILHNFGSLHTQLGAAESRADPESMKKACTHFQCAAWAFGYIKDNYALLLQGDLSTELLIFMQALCFAQAQECIMEKSLCDNRKSGIIAKVTAQIVTYYNSALAALLTQNGEDGRIQDIVGSKQFKEWRKYVKFKISYLSCILLLYQGQQSEEQQKMGERVVLYQASFDKLEEAKKESKGLANIEQINDALQFTMDVVEAKRKSAKNENEFIYHEEVPELSAISAVQGANLVHGIPFSVTDPDAMGEDIFHRLVPMKAHESSSVYSEEKADLLRSVGSRVEEKDLELTSFMSSLNLDSINVQNPSSFNEIRLPQGLVDRCADLNAKPNAIPDLVQSMSNLAESCTEVEMMLKEIKHLLKQDEIQEDSYQQKIGQRSNGGTHIAELNREFTKYQEAHNKAGESNDTLRKAMGLHVHNLKILAQPLKDIKEQIPASSEQFDEMTLKDLQGILAKVNEMREQRAKLYQELRDNVTNDDITTQLIALESGSDSKKRMQELFKKELGKHDQLVALLDANLKAQANILKALTDIYARSAPIIKSISEAKTKREQFFSSLQGSYDVYEDLLSKSAKGLEFYRKLQVNVQKLYSRVKAACDVQDEERNQKLKSSTAMKKQSSDSSLPISAFRESPKLSGGPKLKDYLKSGNISLGSIKAAGIDVNPSGYVPPVRPTPVGSESTAPAVSSASGSGGYYQDSYANYNYYSTTTGATNVPPVAADYSQYYQQQQQISSYGPVSTFQSSTNPTITSTQTQPTGFVNPMYQNTVNNYYGNRQTAEYSQYPVPQPSPALSTSSSEVASTAAVPQAQNWNQLNQQFGAMNLQTSTTAATYQPTVDSSSAAGYVPAQPYQVDSSAVSQQYSTTPAYNGYTNQTAAQYQDVSGQYYTQQQQPPPQQLQQPQPQQQLQQHLQTPQGSAYTQPTQLQTDSQATVPLSSTSYPSYPGYSYNPQTGAYDYIGVNQYSTVTQASYINQYSNPNQTTAGSVATPSATPYSPSVAGSYDVNHSQQQQPSYVTAYSNSLTPSTVTQSVTTPAAASINNSAPAYYGSYNYNQTQQPQSSDCNQQYYPQDQTQNSAYFSSGYGSNVNQYQQPIVNNQPTVGPATGQYSTPSNPSTTNNAPNTPYGYNSAVSYPNTTTEPTQPQSYQPPVPAVPQSTSTEQPHTAVTTLPAQTQPQPAASSTVIKKSSNLDLLSGLDFTPVAPATAAPILQPQSVLTRTTADDEVKSEVLTPTKVGTADSLPADVLPSATPNSFKKPSAEPSATSFGDRKPSVDNLSICSDLSSIDQNFDWESASLRAAVVPVTAAAVDYPPAAASASAVTASNNINNVNNSILVQPARDPFEDQATLKWFHKEVERLEKFIDTLNVKTLNGTTPLDGKWKELQDMLVKEESKRQVGVARLFPEKNRSIDCVPYDHARVTLPTDTDNYINAVFVKDLGFGCPQMILAQTPLQNTVNDFWNMIWSQKATVVVCLHTPNEILDTFWPCDINQELTYGDVSVSLVKQFDLTHCIERALRVTMLGSDVILTVTLIQVKLWPKLSAEYMLGIAQNVIGAYRQQSQELKQLTPLIVNCLNGSDRSSLLAVAIASILATQSRKPVLINVVDIWYRICCQRKGALRDPNYIQMSYNIVLNNGHSILNKRGIMTSYQMKTVQTNAAAEKEETINDPFKDLDPLWKLK
ncbi:tyrosine-protein phosphatase non-receptor type 23 [Sabethes cyaneus]|uniref:tyrosine-protein phosphatase non-receptor type 23 n=1 Tax=Sabethes cyaneus TaxID=53552 RepID=UPI00237DC912|nr:tyrosine-protein phosphatase non-receptor type 23 [Sabethes cyaneus]